MEKVKKGGENRWGKGDIPTPAFFFFSPVHTNTCVEVEIG